MSAKVQQLGLLALAGISIVIVGVLTIISHPVPPNLWTLTYVSFGAVAGQAMPTLPVAPKAPVA